MSQDKELEHWQKLSEVCLNVSSTMFAIIFAILFGLWSTVGKPPNSFWAGFFAIAITFLLEVSCCVRVLYVSKKEQMQTAKSLAKLSVVFMFSMIAEMIIL